MYNDYYLIYLYREATVEEILDNFVNRYKNLIYKYVHHFKVSNKDVEDFFQEGILMLTTALKLFNEEYNKTFTRYFELLLKRRFIHIKRNISNYVLCESIEKIEGTYEMNLDFPSENLNLTKYEQNIFNLYLKEKYTIENISKSTGKTIKSIRNAIYRIKKKMEY